LLGEGPRVVLVTDGGEGAVVVTHDGAVRVPAPRVTVVDRIGAGDAFSGGFLAWWSMRGLGRGDLADADAVQAATGYACLVAAKTCERAGAAPPTLEDLTE
jgi:fructokinase